MFRRRIAPRRYARFGLSVLVAMALAVLGTSLGSRPASAADYMYVSLENRTIVRYDVSLATSVLVKASETVFATSSEVPFGLAFDTSGNLFAANGDASTITKFDSSGNQVGGDFVGAGQGLDGPIALAFDAAGNLYAANQNIGTITRYDSAGNRLGTNFVGLGQGLDIPFGLAFDRQGNLYATNYGNNTISKYDSTGALQFIWGTGARPIGVAFVPEPSTYVLGAIASGLMALIARRRKVARRG